MQKQISNPMQFFSKNYLNNNALIETDATDLKTDGLFDFKPYKENNVILYDARAVEFNCWLKDDFGQFLPREADTLILQNINWKDFTITGVLSTGESTELINITGNAAADLTLKFMTKKLSKIIFKITDVNTTYAAVAAGQVRLCKFIFDLKATTETTVQPIVDEGDLRTFDGTLASWTNFEKWGANIKITNIAKSQLNLLKKFIKEDKYVTLIPWAEWEARDIYEIMLVRGKIGTYSVNRWSGLISQTITVEAKEDAYN